jgi:cytochrome c
MSASISPRVPRFLLLLWCTLGALACGGGSGDQPPPPPPAAGAGDLTPFQLEHGIGPITEPITLGPVDAAMAAAGQQQFVEKCSACHKMDEKYVGPALGDVTERRTPAFIINMIMNPQEMVERHPVAKQLLAEHMSYMPYQNVTLDQARQIVEYLRTQTPGAR